MSRNRASIEKPPKPPKVCCFCGMGEDNELEYGKFYEHQGLITHYYCLLLSSNMEQRGTDEEGILGFLAEDITKELRRGKRLEWDDKYTPFSHFWHGSISILVENHPFTTYYYKMNSTISYLIIVGHTSCTYCKKHGATLGCCNVKCKKIFHFPCGLKAGSLHQFFGEFRSFCVNHRPNQKIDDNVQKEIKNVGETLCYICYDIVDPTDVIRTLWAPCCKKNAWFHRTCVQQLAMSAGYFFKCPLCNNKPEFQTAMSEYGIFIPSQDASWELVPNAFQELLYRHDRCDAESCLCPKGRNHTSTNAKWELTLCRTCGSQGIHVGCGGLKWANPVWECTECITILGKSNKLVNPSPNSISRQMDDSESDTDISVGNNSPLPFPKGQESDNMLPVPSDLKIRPGPRSFKLQQVEAIKASESSFKSVSEVTNNLVPESSKLPNNNEITNSNKESSSNDKKYDIIMIDSDDDDVEIISQKISFSLPANLTCEAEEKDKEMMEKPLENTNNVQQSTLETKDSPKNLSSTILKHLSQGLPKVPTDMGTYLNYTLPRNSNDLDQNSYTCVPSRPTNFGIVYPRSSSMTTNPNSEIIENDSSKTGSYNNYNSTIPTINLDSETNTSGGYPIMNLKITNVTSVPQETFDLDPVNDQNDSPKETGKRKSDNNIKIQSPNDNKTVDNNLKKMRVNDEPEFEEMTNNFVNTNQQTNLSIPNAGTVYVRVPITGTIGDNYNVQSNQTEWLVTNNQINAKPTVSLVNQPITNHGNFISQDNQTIYKVWNQPAQYVENSIPTTQNCDGDAGTSPAPKPGGSVTGYGDESDEQSKNTWIGDTTCREKLCFKGDTTMLCKFSGSSVVEASNDSDSDRIRLMPETIPIRDMKFKIKQSNNLQILMYNSFLVNINLSQSTEKKEKLNSIDMYLNNEPTNTTTSTINDYSELRRDDDNVNNTKENEHRRCNKTNQGNKNCKHNDILSHDNCLKITSSFEDNFDANDNSKKKIIRATRSNVQRCQNSSENKHPKDFRITRSSMNRCSEKHDQVKKPSTRYRNENSKFNDNLDCHSNESFVAKDVKKLTKDVRITRSNIKRLKDRSSGLLSDDWPVTDVQDNRTILDDNSSIVNKQVEKTMDDHKKYKNNTCRVSIDLNRIQSLIDEKPHLFIQQSGSLKLRCVENLSHRIHHCQHPYRNNERTCSRCGLCISTKKRKLNRECTDYQRYYVSDR